MKTPKTITVTLEKTGDQYTLLNAEAGQIMYFDDTDENRQKLIKAFTDQFYYILNTEVLDGKKYR